MDRQAAPLKRRQPEPSRSARRAPEPGPSPRGLEAALAELEQTTQALRQLLLDRALRRLAGEDRRGQDRDDRNQARTLLIRLEPLTEQVHAHSQLDTHWRSGRLDHRGLGAVARRPEAQARQLIRTLVWRSFTPQERNELRGLVSRMDQELATEISDAYRSLIIGWAPDGTLDWLGWANGPGIEAAVSALITALEGGDPDATRAAAAELALFVPPPEDPRQTPPRWGHLV